jgi:PAS domain S-box-containing protein
MQKVLSEGTDEFDTLHRTKSGEIRNVHVWTKTLQIGDRPLFYAIFRDVTERKQAEAALRRSERSLREAQSSAGLGRYVLDIATGLWESSDVLDGIFGIDEHYVRSVEGWLALVHPEWRALMNDYLTNDVLGKHGRFDKEYKIVRRNDRAERWLHGLGDLEFDDQGEPVRMRGTIQDITERVQLEAQFVQAQKMESVGRLAGGIAHDFNNLLTVITAYSELLIEDLPADNARRADLEQVLDAARKAANLTRQLLAFSRRQVLEPKVVNLNEVVTGIEKMLKRVIGEDVDLVVKRAPALGAVRIDPGQIEQVIMNLAVNARDAMPKGGKLTIETATMELDVGYAMTHPSVAAGTYVLLAVSDTGVGMDEATKQRIFEPFFTTKEVGKGTGLGLATVYGIVKQSGGHVSVSSELGRGTTLKIYLPCVFAPVEALLPAEAPAEVQGDGETILLVEDEAIVRKVARRVLEQRGYAILEADRPNTALSLAAAAAEPPDLLVTDVIMPELDGPELARRLEARWPGLKVLYLSGYADEAIARHGLLEAGVSFLQKPFTPEALARKVRQVLDGR